MLVVVAPLGAPSDSQLPNSCCNSCRGSPEGAGASVVRVGERDLRRNAGGRNFCIAARTIWRWWLLQVILLPFLYTHILDIDITPASFPTAITGGGSRRRRMKQQQQQQHSYPCAAIGRDRLRKRKRKRETLPA